MAFDPLSLHRLSILAPLSDAGGVFPAVKTNYVYGYSTTDSFDDAIADYYFDERAFGSVQVGDQILLTANVGNGAPHFAQLGVIQTVVALGLLTRLGEAQNDGGGDDDLLGIQTARVELTSADLLALHATPIQIVPAQGAGTVISSQGTMYDYAYGAVAYSGSPPNVATFYGSTSGPQNEAGVDITVGASFVNVAVGNQGNGGSDPSTVDNVGLYLCALSALTLGDGTLTLTVPYLVLTR